MHVEKTDKKYCIYFHINPVRHEIFYVGIGTKERPYQAYKRSVRWHNMYKKYGFVVKVLQSNLTWHEACELEKKYIKKIGRKDNHSGTLINMTDGGDGTGGYEGFWKGKKRAPVSEATKEKLKANNCKYWTGKKRTEESIRKTAEKNRGSKWTDEQRAKLKNRKTWNKGLKGVQVSTRKGIKTGKPMHENTRTALLKYLKGRNVSQETRNKIGVAHKGKIISQETRNKLSKVGKELWRQKKKQMVLLEGS